jgi:kynurenine formamidase
VIDLTHPVPTFEPREGKPHEPDLTRPQQKSEPVPAFGRQAVYELIPELETGQGHFYWGRITIDEHYGTHLDAPGHYRNDPETVEMPNPDRRTAAELTTRDLVGPVVFLDISSRVGAELGKNNGRPSPDTDVTDFSNASRNVVTAADVESIADRLSDGTWVVVRSGWSRFFTGPSLDESPYINGWNFPGFSKQACDRLIAIEDEKRTRINGIVMDNLGIDSGESSAGSPRGKNPWHCHVRGLQRGWKFVENATNLDQFARAKAGSCTLVVGVPKHVAGSGGPARVFALCDPE